MSETIKPVFTCDRLPEVLKDRPLELDFQEYELETKSAIYHYSNCSPCQLIGISALSRRGPLSCFQVQEFLLKHPGPIYAYSPKSLGEWLAIEHIWGRLVVFNEDAPEYRQHYGACGKAACQKIQEIWLKHQRGEVNDLLVERATIPFLVENFAEQNWDMERVFEAQRQRVSAYPEEIDIHLTTLHRIINHSRENK